MFNGDAREHCIMQVNVAVVIIPLRIRSRSRVNIKRSEMPGEKRKEILANTSLYKHTSI